MASGEPEHMRRVARDFAARIHKVKVPLAPLDIKRGLSLRICDECQLECHVLVYLAQETCCRFLKI